MDEAQKNGYQQTWHVCKEDKIRPYPALLCSMCLPSDKVRHFNPLEEINSIRRRKMSNRDHYNPKNNLASMPMEYIGQFYNACSDPCDMLQGPCACGATHHQKEWPDDIQMDVFGWVNSKISIIKRKRRKKMKQCIDCTHVKKGVAGLPADSGECHLNPPTVVPQGTVTAAAYWPVVTDDNFCGSFSPSTACALGRGVTQQEPQHAGHVRPFDPNIKASKDDGPILASSPPEGFEEV